MISSAGDGLLSKMLVGSSRVEHCSHFAVKMSFIARLEQKRPTTKELPVICRLFLENFRIFGIQIYQSTRLDEPEKTALAV